MLRLGSAAKAGVRGCRQLSSKASPKYTPVLVDGVRIPFVTASSLYKDYLAVDLQKIAFNVSHMPVKCLVMCSKYSIHPIPRNSTYSA
jgi:hypothetical protein